MPSETVCSSPNGPPITATCSPTSVMELFTDKGQADSVGILTDALMRSASSSSATIFVMG